MSQGRYWDQGAMPRSSRLDGGHEFPAATHAVTRTESFRAGSLQVWRHALTHTAVRQLSRSFPPVGRVKRGACGRAPP